MKSDCTALIQQSGKWWIGWIEEIPGISCQGETREELLENLRSALKGALKVNYQEALVAATGSYEEVSIEV